MGVMTIPEAWYVQDRALTVEDMEYMPDDESRLLDRRAGCGSPRADRVRAALGLSHEQTAHVTGDEEYRAQIPFPVTITPSRLVSPPS